MFRSSAKHLARVGGPGRATEDHESDKVMRLLLPREVTRISERGSWGNGRLLYILAQLILFITDLRKSHMMWRRTWRAITQFAGKIMSCQINTWLILCRFYKLTYNCIQNLSFLEYKTNARYPPLFSFLTINSQNLLPHHWHHYYLIPILSEFT